MRNHKLGFKCHLFLCFSFLVIFVLGGCSIVDYFKTEGPPSDAELYENYEQTELKVSNTGEVMALVHDPEYELLSQSGSVIASFGQKKKGYKSWFNMVAFDENELTARRKYFFLVDEKAKGVPFRSKRRLRFESRMVMERKVLDEPYANQNARRIAILRQVLADLRKDIDEVKVDNKMLEARGMLINRTLETILRGLDESPVLASQLGSVEGVAFDHITLGKGRVWMDVAEDVVDVKVEIDSFAGKLEDPFSLEE